jgi:hypothetical protein
MAFCTNCGAQVNGAFCNQCGTPARAGAAQAPPPPPSMSPPGPAAAQAPPPMYQPGPGAAPVKRKTSPIVWVLVIIVGIFVLGAIGIVGTGLFVVHKARQAGLDPTLMQRNPAYAAAKMIVAMNPDLTEVRHDDNAGTITVRDKNTGKESTLSFDDIKNGKIRFSATDEKGETATMEIGGGTGKLPSWVPEYPGASGKGTFSIQGNSRDGSAQGGNYSFTTRDPAAKVIEYYQEKLKDLGMSINVTSSTDQGGMFVATDDKEKRSLTVVVGESSGETTVSLIYGDKLR